MAIAALIAVFVAALGFSSFSRAGETPPAPGAAAGGTNSLVPSAGFVSSGPVTQPPTQPQQTSVARLVAEQNVQSKKEAERFVAAGWTMVEVAPPDAQLVQLDPALLNGREPELRAQMTSTAASSADAPRLAEIARRASSAETQVAAVEALGRAGGESAQHELQGLLTTLPQGSAARREVAPLLRPSSLSDPRALELARLLDSPSLDPAERQQLAFTLALVGLRDQSALPAAALAGLPADSQRLLASMTSLARLDSTPAAR